jgi:hypothetical protein
VLRLRGKSGYEQRGERQPGGIFGHHVDLPHQVYAIGPWHPGDSSILIS